MVKPEKHIFVCTSSRMAGQQSGFCRTKGGIEIVSEFIEEIQDRDLGEKVIVTNTGCLSICEKGPIVVVYPDNTWYFGVSPYDVEEIIESHIEEGIVVDRLTQRS